MHCYLAGYVNIQACVSELDGCEYVHMSLLNMCAVAIVVLVTLQEVRVVDVDDKAITALTKEMKRQGSLPTPQGLLSNPCPPCHSTPQLPYSLQLLSHSQQYR